MSPDNDRPTRWQWLNSDGGPPPRCIDALAPKYDELSLFLMAAALVWYKGVRSEGVTDEPVPRG